MLFWTWMEHAQWWKLQLFFGNWRCTIESILVKNSQFVVKNDFWLNLKSFQWKCFEFSSVLHQFILHKSPLETCLPHRKKRCIPSIHVNESSCAHHFTVKFSPSICYQYAVFFYILASKFRYKHSMVMPWSMLLVFGRVYWFSSLPVCTLSLSLSIALKSSHTHAIRTNPTAKWLWIDIAILKSVGLMDSTQYEPVRCQSYHSSHSVWKRREKKNVKHSFSEVCSAKKDREKNGT